MALYLIAFNDERVPDLTDGPFAETKEHLGGFAVVDVPGDAEARYWAGRPAGSRSRSAGRRRCTASSVIGSGTRTDLC